MSIYNFNQVTKFLKEHGADTVYHNKREFYFRTKHPALYSSLMSATLFLGTSSFIERLYCFTNNITSRPKCQCGKEVSFSRTREYHTYCSQRCSLLDMKSLIGVENSSQLVSVKQKKKDSALKKYGVDNVSKAKSVKGLIGKKAVDRWEKEYLKLGSVFPLPVKVYQKLVARFTELSYRTHKDLIDPQGIRSNDWHLDHKFSVYEGYRHGVPPEVIGHRSNLCMLDKVSNSFVKNKKCSITLDQLLEQYQSS